MAFENGREANMYIGGCIEAYIQNPNIFDKLTQITAIFIKRSDWPYSIVKLNNIGQKLMECHITSIISFCERYLNNKEIVWPDDLPDNFKRDLEVFYLSVGQIFSQYWNSSPMKLNSITELNDYSNPQILRFIRNDGKFMDFQMGNNEINRAIDMLKEHLTK